LSARIKYYRVVKDWSQEQLSEQACINRTYLAGIERGRRNPSIRSIVKLANAFRVPLSVMFEPIPPGAEDLTRSGNRNRGRKRSRR
jgi:transcriptional regulator with XRE-family HTH domain